MWSTYRGGLGAGRGGDRLATGECWVGVCAGGVVDRETFMLQLSESASTAIRDLVERPELPDLAGVRIAGDASGSGQLTVSTAATPEAGDQVVEDQGARVFIEPGAAVILDDKVLDAAVDERGRMGFVLSSQ
jgi:iron-sulfur cluster assembly protein